MGAPPMGLDVVTHELSPDEKVCVRCGVSVPQPIEGKRRRHRTVHRVGLVTGLKVIPDSAYYVGENDSNRLCREALAI
jgi:hypothetical protein